MKLFFVIIVTSSLHLSRCAKEPGTQSVTKNPADATEDLRVLNEAIAMYGPPQDYKKLGFPGPKIALDSEKYTYFNQLQYENGSDNYILRIRTITPNFSYLGHYEEVKMPDNFTQFPEIKGQVGEHFARKNGGFYVRTIGYKVDENGYRQFLLDLTIANTITKEVTESPTAPLTYCGVDYLYTVGFGGTTTTSAGSSASSYGGFGGGTQAKTTISSTVLLTLTGGNTLG
nr:PREDICTED: uncharacterized protein LOC103314637 [Tribolium castaneum]|eukprot:XP_008199337.1 PREDICTED: uncharacterized protein LOC103314637 [Tribolium castaneum]